MEQLMLIALPELTRARVLTLLARMWEYLESPEWDSTVEGTEYVCSKLRAKGINPVIVESPEYSIGLDVQFEWSGWLIQAGEEVQARNLRTGEQVIYGMTVS